MKITQLSEAKNHQVQNVHQQIDSTDNVVYYYLHQ